MTKYIALILALMFGTPVMAEEWIVLFNVSTALPGYEKCVKESVVDYFKKGEVPARFTKDYAEAEIYIEFVAGETFDKEEHIATVMVMIKPITTVVQPLILLTGAKATTGGKKALCDSVVHALDAYITRVVNVLNENKKKGGGI